MRRPSPPRCATSPRCWSTATCRSAPLPVTVAYHDACHLAHGQRVRTQPRELLRRIPGLTPGRPHGRRALLRQRGGLQPASSPRWPASSAAERSARIRETGASIVAAGNPGCLMQIAQHCRAAGRRGRGARIRWRCWPGPCGRSGMRSAGDEDPRSRSTSEVLARQDGEDRARHDRPRPARSLLRGARARRRSPTATTTRTRSTTCSRATAASRSAASEERLAAGEALVAPAGVEHGLVNDGDRAAAGPGGGHAAAAPREAATRPLSRASPWVRVNASHHDHLPRRRVLSRGRAWPW